MARRLSWQFLVSESQQSRKSPLALMFYKLTPLARFHIHLSASESYSILSGVLRFCDPSANATFRPLFQQISFCLPRQLTVNYNYYYSGWGKKGFCDHSTADHGPTIIVINWFVKLVQKRALILKQIYFKN